MDGQEKKTKEKKILKGTGFRCAIWYGLLGYGVKVSLDSKQVNINPKNHT